MKQLRNDIPIVLGNKKLPKTTAILNVTPASTCVSCVLGMCQLRNPDKECYAKSEERVWANTCIPSRLAMQCYWDMNTPWTIARDLLAYNEGKRTKIAALRINECGDFRHQADLDKAEMLAHYLEKNGIATYCYTARRDLDFSEAKSLTVNGSGWMCHNRFQVAYKLVPGELGGKKWLAETADANMVGCDYACPGDCRKCSVCLFKRGRTTAVLLH